MAQKKELLKKTNKKSEPVVEEYVRALSDIKLHIQQAQVKAALAANKELILLYWTIGKTIAEKQKE